MASQIKEEALRGVKTECSAYLVINDILFRIKIYIDTQVEATLLLVITEICILTS